MRFVKQETTSTCLSVIKYCYDGVKDSIPYQTTGNSWRACKHQSGTMSSKRAHYPQRVADYTYTKEGRLYSILTLTPDS